MTKNDAQYGTAADAAFLAQSVPAAEPSAFADPAPGRGASRWLIGALLGVVAGFSVATAAVAAETRTLDLYNTHTKERLTITFKKNGRYVGSALKELNRFLRDWRRNEPTNMDPRLFDTVWEVYSRSGSRQPIHVVSAYRSPATNNMLRSRSKGVAKHSQHTLGKAMDFFLPDVKVSKLREIGIGLQRGGVGFYPTANNPFVHIDVGSVRAWPRMSRQQLARIFPDGKTVHLPADGKPMPRYQEALAELKRNGSVARPLAIAEDEPAKKRPVGLLAMLFGDEEDETEELNAASTTGQSLTAPDDGPGPVVRSAPSAAEPAKQPEPAAPPPATLVVEAPVPPSAPARPADPAVTSLAEATLPAGAPAPAAVAAVEPPPAPPARPEDLVEVAAVDPSVRPRPRPEIAVAEDAPVQVASADAPSLPPLPDEPADARMALAEVARDPDSGTDPLTALGYASAIAEPPAFNRNAPVAMASLAPAPAARGLVRGGDDSLSPLPQAAAPIGAKADPLAVLTRLPPPTALPIFDGRASAWTGVFATLSHPNQRSPEVVFTTPRMVVSAGFDRRPYGGMSSVRFTGSALRPLTVKVFNAPQRFAAR